MRLPYPPQKLLLDENKAHVNELNVFPVPDGDTGTNMSMTMLSASRELSACSTNNMPDNVYIYKNPVAVGKYVYPARATFAFEQVRQVVGEGLARFATEKRLFLIKISKFA